MNKQRPINLDLHTIKFPLPAIASILHRISGLLLVLLIPFLLAILAHSLRSAAGFKEIQVLFSSLGVKIALWLLLSGLVYHLFAGVRHLFMDLGIGDSFQQGCFSAKLVLLLLAIVMVLLGVWLW